MIHQRRMRCWLLLAAICPALAIRERDENGLNFLEDRAARGRKAAEREKGVNLYMLAEVMFVGECSIFGLDQRLLTVVVEDMNKPSRYYKMHKFQFKMVDMRRHKKAFKVKLEDVPISANLMATVYVKQMNSWFDIDQWLGWSLCGRKSAHIGFPDRFKVHIQPFAKESAEFFYQYIQLTFRAEHEKVIKQLPPPTEVIESAKTHGRPLVKQVEVENQSQKRDDEEDQELVVPPVSPPPEVGEPAEPVDPAEPAEPEEAPVGTEPEPPLEGSLSKDEDEGIENIDQQLDQEMSSDKDDTDKGGMTKLEEETTPDLADLSLKSGQEEIKVESEDLEDLASLASLSGMKPCEMCTMRLGLGMEGMLCERLPDIVEALCDMDDCNEKCSGDWNGVTIGCAKDASFNKAMYEGLRAHCEGAEMEIAEVMKEAEPEEVAISEKTQAKAQQYTEEEDSLPNDADPTAKAMKECQAGRHGGSWKMNSLEHLMQLDAKKSSKGKKGGRGRRGGSRKLKKKEVSKPALKKWLKKYCAEVKPSDESFSCVGVATKMKGMMNYKAGGSCGFDLWLKSRGADEWTKSCPWNRWRICEPGEKKCRGKGMMMVNWAACYARPKK